MYVRQSGQSYTTGTDVGLIQAGTDGVVRYASQGLPNGVLNYFAVTAYDASARESALSNELSLLVGTPVATSTPTAAATSPPLTATRTSTLAGTVTRTPTRTGTSTATGTATATRSPASTSTRTPTPTATSTPVPTLPAAAAYGFNEGSGTTAVDATGNGHTGTLFGSPVWTTGAYGSGLRFSGGTTYDGVNLSSNNAFDEAAQGTLEAWVKFDTSASGYHAWFDAHDTSGCSYPFEVHINNTGSTVYWEIWAGNTSACTATFNARVPLPNPSQWHHLAYVVNGTGNTWYVDGAPQAPTYLVGSAASTFFLASIAAGPNTRYDIGTTDNPAETFKGVIDELRIYDQPLSQAQVQADLIRPISSVVPTSTATRTPTRTGSPPATPTATRTPTGVPGGPVVSGTILYYADGEAVPNATLALQGTSATLNTSSDATGQFDFPSVSAGTWTLQPQKQGDLGNAISALDAAYVLQAVSGLRTFDELQSLACDVTGNGTLSALDATRILQYSVGQITRLPVAQTCGSDWLFVPDPLSVPGQQLVQPQVGTVSCQPGAIVFAPLSASAPQQDFTALPFGDCTGNWSTGSGAALQLRSGAISARLGAPRPRPGGRWAVPLYVYGLNTLDAVMARVAYDPAAAELEDVRLVGAGTGPLKRYHADTSGVVAHAAASAQPLAAGARPLAVLDFRAEAAPVVRLLNAMVDEVSARVGDW